LYLSHLLLPDDDVYLHHLVQQQRLMVEWVFVVLQVVLPVVRVPLVILPCT
jgi:hypothetical protein